MTTKPDEFDRQGLDNPNPMEEEAFSPGRPSYLPPHFDMNSIPPTLVEETAFWTTGKGQILTEESANALLEAEELSTTLHRDGRILEGMGLNPHLPGHESLKGHSTRVAVLSLLINDGLKMYSSSAVTNTRILAKAAMLHDFGKMDPEVNRVVMSNQKYEESSSEWVTITRHPEIGAEVVLSTPNELIPSSEKVRIAEAIYKHHERFDGSGYHKTPASRIPHEAAIISVADTIDAMGEHRTYKGPFATKRVMAELERCKEKFNGDILEIIRKMRSMSGVFVRHRSIRA